MKYVDEFRDGALARRLAAAIAREVDPAREYRFMEFCGGHTHAIARYGVEDLLPANVRLIHGPGCPVCVLPTGRLEMAIALAERPGVMLASYGDMLRVPGSGGDSLLKARARGADVRMVYSIDDALALARRHPDRQVIFFAIGFETTTPPTAVAIRQAAAEGLGNFSVFCNHVLTPSAIASILESPEVRDLGSVKLDGFVGPAHVSTVIGSRPYEYFAAEYAKPVVIAGFEPLDVLQAEGVHLDALRLRAFPFPDSVPEFIAAHEKVFVVEQNRDAQMHSMLVNELDIDPARMVRVLHYDGTPITARFIAGAVRKNMVWHKEYA